MTARIKKNIKLHPITIDGVVQELPLTRICYLTHKSKSFFRTRICEGMTIDEALNEAPRVKTGKRETSDISKSRTIKSEGRGINWSSYLEFLKCRVRGTVE